jgi:hypothetical protein
MFSNLLNAQGNLDTLFERANAEMRVRNLYQTIAWRMSSLNEYQFDQVDGYVQYMVSDTNMEAKATPKVLGTFNLEDNTFLWADKNPSIRPYLSNLTDSCRMLLPEKYRQDKFESTTDFNKNLLALFSYQINANAFDIHRQGNAIIYYALMRIEIFESAIKTKTFEPGNHVVFIKNDAAINTIKAYHREKVEINRLHFGEEISLDEAFNRMRQINSKYWLHGNGSSTLSWPCHLDEKSTGDWQVFRIPEGNRCFVTYASSTGSSVEQYAYEIDANAVGQKIIIGEY